MSEPESSYSTQDLAAALGSELRGEVRDAVGLSSETHPKKDTVVVLTDPSRLAALTEVAIAAAVVAEPTLPVTTTPVIPVKDSQQALARLSSLFDTSAKGEGVHPSAVIHPGAQLAEDVSVGAHSVICEGVVIGNGTVIGPACVIGAGSRLGEQCRIASQVSLYPNVHLGQRVRLHSGVVVGSDGFGYAVSDQGAAKIHHLGNVVVEDDVEIGANTCVDRATLDETRIGARSKIDNLCQIAHNVTIGADCLIAAMVGIAGSTTLGRGVVVGGAAGFADHLVIGDGARIAANAGVTKNVPAGETWAGFPAQPYKRWVRTLYLIGQLESVWTFVRKGGRREP